MLLIEEDISDTMEFSEYVCIELVNITTTFILEQGSDPRLATAPQVNSSVGTPGDGGGKK
jgi:hypothetical protein